jgi:hypothetical protein
MHGTTCLIATMVLVGSVGCSKKEAALSASASVRGSELVVEGEGPDGKEVVVVSESLSKELGAGDRSARIAGGTWKVGIPLSMVRPGKTTLEARLIGNMTIIDTRTVTVEVGAHLSVALQCEPGNDPIFYAALNMDGFSRGCGVGEDLRTAVIAKGAAGVELAWGGDRHVLPASGEQQLLIDLAPWLAGVPTGVFASQVREDAQLTGADGAIPAYELKVTAKVGGREQQFNVTFKSKTRLAAREGARVVAGIAGRMRTGDAPPTTATNKGAVLVEVSDAGPVMAYAASAETPLGNLSRYGVATREVRKIKCGPYRRGDTGVLYDIPASSTSLNIASWSRSGKPLPATRLDSPGKAACVASQVWGHVEEQEIGVTPAALRGWLSR